MGDRGKKHAIFLTGGVFMIAVFAIVNTVTSIVSVGFFYNKMRDSSIRLISGEPFVSRDGDGTNAIIDSKTIFVSATDVSLELQTTEQWSNFSTLQQAHYPLLPLKISATSSIQQQETSNATTSFGKQHQQIALSSVQAASKASDTNNLAPKRLLPRRIFSIWMQGWDDPSAELWLANRRTWEILNPTYEFHFLNESQAEELTDRRRYIPQEVWQNLTIQHKTDIYRVILIYEYGGIWVDASVSCGVPLDSWLSDQPDFLSFRRPYEDLSEEGKELGLDPWITNWFMATPPKGYYISRIFDMITNSSNFHLFTSEYFWFHRMVSNMNREDPVMMRRTLVFPLSSPFHCRGEDFLQRAPLFKRCAARIFRKLLKTAEVCCELPSHYHDGNQTISTKKRRPFRRGVCQDWDCSVLSPNEKLFIPGRLAKLLPSRLRPPKEPETAILR